MAANYRFLVIGDDAASLCAAAAAAARGERTALTAPGARRPGGPSVCDIPNFVWRRLNLQDFALEIAPVSARVTLFADGAAASTYRDTAQTTQALRDSGVKEAALWPDFADEMHVLAGAAATVRRDGALAATTSADTLASLATITGCAEELVADYIDDGPLDLHLRAHALGPYGYAGDEPASAHAVAEMFDEASWRVRAAPGARSILGALRKVCDHLGVATITEKFTAAKADGAQTNLVEFGDGEAIRTQHIVFASPDAACAAGYHDPRFPASHNAMHAALRLKLRDRVAPPAGDEQALFQIVDAPDDLRRARRAVMQGRIPQRLPMAFEFTDKGDIVARTAYAPVCLRDEDGMRGWTGQDRQALTNAMVDRLASRMPALRDRVRRTDLSLQEATPRMANPFADAHHILLQPDRHNAIAAAVAMIDRALDNE